MPHKPLTHRDAIEAAKLLAVSRNLPWNEHEVDVRLNKGLLQVTTNWSRMGGNLVVRFDPSTGAVRHCVYYDE